MKKGLISVGFMIVSALSISANAEDKSGGCGLGWKIAPQTSLVSSYTRAITNTMTSNTSGMTSGTSGCDKHSIVRKESEQIHFAESNFHNLMIEMAQGSGTYITSFGYVMGCNESNVNNFTAMSQQNYAQFFPKIGGSPAQLIQDMTLQMTQNKVCQN